MSIRRLFGCWEPFLSFMHFEHPSHSSEDRTSALPCMHEAHITHLWFWKILWIIYPTCKITNRISFARNKNASDQFRVENRHPLKLNFRGGLFSNQSWSEAPGASYGHFSTSQVAPSMISFCKFTSTLIGDHPVTSDFAKTLITLEP